MSSKRLQEGSGGASSSSKKQRFAKQPQLIEVVVTSSGGKEIKLELPGTGKALDVKKGVEEQQGAQCRDTRLYLLDSTREDELDNAEYLHDLLGQVRILPAAPRLLSRIKAIRLYDRLENAPTCAGGVVKDPGIIVP